MKFSAEETTTVIHILESLGFIVNKEKSQLVLSQRTEFLGSVIDTVNMVASFSERKITNLVDHANFLREENPLLNSGVSSFYWFSCFFLSGS